MKLHLSTSSFNGYGKRIASFLLAFVLFYAAFAVVAVTLTSQRDDRNDSQKITKYQLEDFYALPKNSLDVLILGSSHAMCTYDPARIEKATGQSVFNLGTALQQPDTAYFLLREVLKTQKPKTLIYDVYFKVLQDEYAADQATTVLKEMRFSPNAMALFWQNLDTDAKVSYYNTWLNPFARIGNVMQGAGQKNETTRTPFYRGRGFYSTTNTVKPEELTPEKHPFSREYTPFHARQIEYLKKLLTLAQENKIDVLLVSAPIPPTILSRIDYYDRMHAEIANLAADFSLPYYDFAREGDLTLQDTDFADQGHLNHDGDRKFMDNFLAFLAKMNFLTR